jgi:mono/diheme cytochrome c family protein
VNKDGTPQLPVMPYLNYAKADPDDIQAVIAYLRSLDPIENTIPKAEPDFPMSIILHTIPQKSEPGSIPDNSDLVAYGAYMITIAACADCHTNEINGKKVGLPYAGGREFQMPDGSLLRVANITPHETGIGRWSEEQFKRRFKHYVDSTYTLPSVNPGEFQTIMPWMMYAGMEEYDLKAIYHYLRSLEPAENRVT